MTIMIKSLFSKSVSVLVMFISGGHENPRHERGIR